MCFIAPFVSLIADYGNCLNFQCYSEQFTFHATTNNFADHLCISDQT
nr:MAG TPA: hypothetical protein [Caudoviricetes sp.]